jgi:ankyrin repeat protein
MMLAATGSTASKCPFASSGASKAQPQQPVDVNAVNFDSETALMFAAENGHDAVVELLIKHSPLLDVGKRNKRGWTAFSLAARAGHLATVKLLLEAEVAESMAAATVAGSEQQAKQRRDLVVAVINQQDRNGCTSLIHASGQHHRDVVTFLLQQGADLRLCDLDGVSCLARALHRGALEISLDLIAFARATLPAADAQAFLNARSVDGDCALSICSAYGHLDIVRALLQSDDASGVSVHVEVNGQDSLGFSPLMRAAARGHTKVVEMLLAAGADDSLTNIDGKTMHNVAMILSNP